MGPVILAITIATKDSFRPVIKITGFPPICIKTKASPDGAQSSSFILSQKRLVLQNGAIRLSFIEVAVFSLFYNILKTKKWSYIT